MKDNKDFEERRQKITLHLTKTQIKSYKKLFSVLEELDFIARDLESLYFETKTLKEINKKDKLQIIQKIDEIAKYVKVVCIELFNKYNDYNLKHIDNKYESDLVKSKIINILIKLYMKGGEQNED